MLYGICEIGNETFYMLRDPGPEGYGATRLVSYNALCTQYLFHDYNKEGDYRLDQTGVWIHTIVKESAYTENEIWVDI